MVSVRIPYQDLDFITAPKLHELDKSINYLLLSSEHGCISILVLLDLNAAFDTIDHNIAQQLCWYW